MNAAIMNQLDEEGEVEEMLVESLVQVSGDILIGDERGAGGWNDSDQIDSKPCPESEHSLFLDDIPRHREDIDPLLVGTEASNHPPILQSRS